MDVEKGLPSLVIHKEYLSKERRVWLFMTWFATWWIPSPLLKCCGMKRTDVRLAFREKLCFVFIVVILCSVLLFVNIGIPYLLCPKQNVMSLYEVEKYNKLEGKKLYVSFYGRYYDIREIYNSHVKGTLGIDDFQFRGIFGSDVSQMFYPARNWENKCPGITNPGDTWDNLIQRNPQKYWPHYMTDPTSKAVIDYMGYMEKYVQGKIVWNTESLSANSNSASKFVVIFDNVYDIATYASASNPFFDGNMGKLFSNFVGKDATSYMKTLLKSNPEYYTQVLRCMNNIFYVGNIDHRQDFACKLSNYIMSSLSVAMASIIILKFLCSVYGFRESSNPEILDKFVIIQVPCFSESSKSLEKTFNSIAKSDYRDSNKLMFVVCDGLVKGGGNNKSTPENVLDILFGEDYNRAIPPSLEYQAIGDGYKQYNTARIYSGHYNVIGHKLPFIVLVKTGSEQEANTSKPGNRGKRDSQVILMRFLNRVYSEQSLTPLECELYYHFENVIGVSPKAYEYLCMVDADTQLKEPALSKFVMTMVSDKRITGVCGDTKVSNDQSILAKIQIYEYFISHHLGKSFESCFGTVTCLPGCFCMYRIRTSTNHPVFIHEHVLEDYAETRVDTLHKKNLLSLGEDRYLTTLMLKHISDSRTVFIPDAECETIVPETFKVFRSQRRRWINSTIHNLWELKGLQLCGICLFSMNFVIWLELFSSLIAPAAIAYLVYMIVVIVQDPETIPVVALATLGGIYALQFFIVLLKNRLDNFLCMFAYILAIPIFSLYIPCYAFWNMDDFTWGSTRLTVSDKNTTEYQIEDDHFDAQRIIPRQYYQQFILAKEMEKNNSQAGCSSDSIDVSSSVSNKMNNNTRRNKRGRRKK